MATVGLLLSSDQIASRPATCVEVHNFGYVTVRFGDGYIHGTHCVVNGPAEDMRKWLAPYEQVPVSVGKTYQEQQFEMASVKTS